MFTTESWIFYSCFNSLLFSLMEHTEAELIITRFWNDSHQLYITVHNRGNVFSSMLMVYNNNLYLLKWHKWVGQKQIHVIAFSCIHSAVDIVFFITVNIKIPYCSTRIVLLVWCYPYGECLYIHFYNNVSVLCILPRLEYKTTLFIYGLRRDWRLCWCLE